MYENYNSVMTYYFLCGNNMLMYVLVMFLTMIRVRKARGHCVF
jgi:hypothetical protein